MLDRPFEFGNFANGNLILPHFYLLERHKGDERYWHAHESIIRHLKEAVNRRKENGGGFSGICKESIDRFLLKATGEYMFAHINADSQYCQTPKEACTQAWLTLLYGQKAIWLFPEKELGMYVTQRLADFDALEDLNLQGLLGIGLVL